MKITKQQLKQIIKEEIEATMDEGIGKTLGMAALGLGLGLGSGDAQAAPTSAASAPTTQQANVPTKPNKIQKDSDGYSMLYLNNNWKKNPYVNPTHDIIQTQAMTELFNSIGKLKNENPKDFNYELINFQRTKNGAVEGYIKATRK